MAEGLRERLLEANPHHMIRPNPSFEEAMQAPDVQVHFRRWLLLAVTLALAGIAGAIFLCGRASWPVTRANYNRIKIGMTETEVEAILGGPGEELGPLNNEDIHADERPLLIARSPLPHDLRMWTSATHKISVIFDGNRNVVSKSYSRPAAANLPQRIIDWLGI